MKVALATFVYEKELGGGAAQVVQTLAQSLIRRGVEVIVITTHNERRVTITRDPGLTVLRFFPLNLYWVAHKDRQAHWKKVLWQLIDLWNPYTYMITRQILEQVQPDIFHVHKLRGLSPALWSGAKAAHTKAVLQTCHDYELLSPEGTLTGRLGLSARHGTWPLGSYQRLRAKWSRGISTVTAPSSYTLRTITDLGFFPGSIRCVVPNSHGLTAVQLEAQAVHVKQRMPAELQTIDILYLGRLDMPKGVEVLCAAFMSIASLHPQSRLHVAGWGLLADSLQQRFSWSHQVVFHGAVFGHEKQQLLAMCMCTVVPSIWPEVFGIVIIEAYAYGKPVIATAIGGMPELIEPGVTGWLIPPNDQKALAAVLAQVIEHPVEVRQMADACFAAAGRYTPDGVVDKYMGLYDQTLQHR